MTRHFNTPHLDRGKSTYSTKDKRTRADKYGNFDQGRQVSPDRIAGRTVWYPVEKENKDA